MKIHWLAAALIAPISAQAAAQSLESTYAQSCATPEQTKSETCQALRAALIKKLQQDDGAGSEDAAATAIPDQAEQEARFGAFAKLIGTRWTSPPNANGIRGVLAINLSPDGKQLVLDYPDLGPYSRHGGTLTPSGSSPATFEYEHWTVLNGQRLSGTTTLTEERPGRFVSDWVPSELLPEHMARYVFEATDDWLVVGSALSADGSRPAFQEYVHDPVSEEEFERVLADSRQAMQLLIDEKVANSGQAGSEPQEVGATAGEALAAAATGGNSDGDPGSGSAPSNEAAPAQGLTRLEFIGGTIFGLRSIPGYDVAGTYLSKGGEPRVELKSDGTGCFARRGKPCRPMEWWVAAYVNGEQFVRKVPGGQENQIVLWFSDSNTFEMVDLQIDDADGSMRILGDRIKQR